MVGGSLDFRHDVERGILPDVPSAIIPEPRPDILVPEMTLDNREATASRKSGNEEAEGPNGPRMGLKKAVSRTLVPLNRVVRFTEIHSAQAQIGLGGTSEGDARRGGMPKCRGITLRRFEQCRGRHSALGGCVKGLSRSCAHGLPVVKPFSSNMTTC